MLRIAGLKPVSSKLANTEGAGEETPAIAYRLEVNDPDVTERCWMKLHGIMPISSGIGYLATTAIGGDAVVRKPMEELGHRAMISPSRVRVMHGARWPEKLSQMKNIIRDSRDKKEPPDSGRSALPASAIEGSHAALCLVATGDRSLADERMLRRKLQTAMHSSLAATVTDLDRFLPSTE